MLDTLEETLAASEALGVEDRGTRMVEGRAGPLKTDMLDSLVVDAAIGRMNAIMRENEFFKEEEITLKRVAGMMNINPQQLSEILNSSLHTSFSTYVNDYKIAEAKTLMMEHPDYQITRIALMAGFNSTRTFNRAFMKREGLTPLNYRKRLAGKRRSGPGDDHAL